MDEDGVKVWRARFDRLWKAVLLPVAGLLLINGCYHINTGRWESDRAFGGWCVFWAIVLAFSPLLVKWGAMLAKWVWTGEKLPPKMTEEGKRRAWAIFSTAIFAVVILLAVIIVVGDMAIREKLKENAARRAIDWDNSVTDTEKQTIDDRYCEKVKTPEQKFSDQMRSLAMENPRDAPWLNKSKVATDSIKTPEEIFRESVWQIVKSPLPADKKERSEEWINIILIMGAAELKAPGMEAERKAIKERFNKLVDSSEYKSPWTVEPVVPSD